MSPPFLGCFDPILFILAARGTEHSGCVYTCPSVALVKIFVQGRLSGTIDDKKLKKCLFTYNNCYNGKNNVSGRGEYRVAKPHRYILPYEILYCDTY